ncbi:MAG: hypothetical protein HYY04_06745, partial [Chloroflexi bacterium]|nr:hypothetical protein [Chloroflexota bacterium]
MDVAVNARRGAEIETDALVVNLFEGEKPGEGALSELDQAVGGGLSRLVDLGELRGKLHEVAAFIPDVAS